MNLILLILIIAFISFLIYKQFKKENFYVLDKIGELTNERFDDCYKLPIGPNEKFDELLGCNGAVNKKGKASKRQCKNKREKYPWYEKCCKWMGKYKNSNKKGMCRLKGKEIRWICEFLKRHKFKDKQGKVAVFNESSRKLKRGRKCEGELEYKGEKFDYYIDGTDKDTFERENVFKLQIVGLINKDTRHGGKVKEQNSNEGSGSDTETFYIDFQNKKINDNHNQRWLEPFGDPSIW